MKVSAVVLAAGSASRFGSDKLMAKLDGRPVFEHVLDALSGFPFYEILAVVRPGYSVDGPMRRVENSRADDGMGHSLAIGIASLKTTDAAFVVLADMPFLPDGIFHQLAGHLPGREIVVPRHKGQAGHPVLFSSVCFPRLVRLEGDRGGRVLISSGDYHVGFVDNDSDGVLRDIDRPDDLRR